MLRLQQGEAKRKECDVCLQRSTYRDLRYGECKTCEVGVHLTCYGIGDPQDGKTSTVSFECWACQAIGKRFQVEDWTSSGERVRLKQAERPTRCELCGVSTGIHAMHPLFDNHGNKGRQIQQKDEKMPRLAWCHTACAQVISLHGGLVFGALRNGRYDSKNCFFGGDIVTCRTSHL